MKPASTATLVSALRVLSQEMVSMDGVANAVVAEAAERMQALVELTAKQATRIKQLEKAGEACDCALGIAYNDIRQHLQVANYNLHGLMNTGEKIEPPNPPQTIHQAGIDASMHVCAIIEECRRHWTKTKAAKA